MAAEWRNNGEPVDGVYIADVDPEDGGHVQTFQGATVKEVTDKLLKAQFHASRFINDLKKERTPDPLQQRRGFAPRKLTADEEFQAAQDLRDPAKVGQAIEKIVEARLGAPLSEIARRMQNSDDKEVAEDAVAETKKFVENTPDWDPTEDNKLTLATYMQEQKMAWTAKNFSIAFEKLMGDGLLTRKPESITVPPEETAPERIVPQQTTRPRGSFSTGVLPSQFGNNPPPKPKSKYTRQDIDNMPKSVYRHKMDNEAGFAAIVNALA